MWDVTFRWKRRPIIRAICVHLPASMSISTTSTIRRGDNEAGRRLLRLPTVYGVTKIRITHRGGSQPPLCCYAPSKNRRNSAISSSDIPAIASSPLAMSSISRARASFSACCAGVRCRADRATDETIGEVGGGAVAATGGATGGATGAVTGAGGVALYRCLHWDTIRNLFCDSATLSRQSCLAGRFPCALTQ